MKTKSDILPQFIRFSLTFSIILMVSALVSGCKKDDPSPEGNLLFYTFLDAYSFDAIEIYVDGKNAGKLTLPHITEPDCSHQASINLVKVPVPAGHHKWYAKQIKDGKEIDEWDERSEMIDAGECESIELTE